jgi:hypothetical protein
MRRNARALVLSVAVASLCAVLIAGRNATALGQALTRSGDISAQGAFTCELTLPASVTVSYPEPIAAALERDRIIMAREPGLLRKHIPLSFDPATGNLLAGGRYLFDTEQHAQQYKAFVEGYTLNGIKFLERPEFIEQDCHAWSVIGARDFTDVHTTHVILRTERWQVPPSNQRHWLEGQWASIRSEAQARGLTGAWLLYNYHERLVTLVYFADRLVPQDPSTPDFVSLAALETAPPLGAVLESASYAKVFDRTQWSWTIWFPVLAGDRGEPSRWPNSPPLPEPYSGDGVCEVSRGETHANSPTDCGSTCGDTICQPGETTQSCPGDCRP